MTWDETTKALANVAADLFNQLPDHEKTDLSPCHLLTFAAVLGVDNDMSIQDYADHIAIVVDVAGGFAEEAGFDIAPGLYKIASLLNG